MNLVNPTGLWLAALAAPIIGLYILKIRLRRAPVSTIQFWRRIYEEKKPRSIWQRLRHWISLALQLAFLALLTAALADPIFRWQQGQGRRRVLVLDDSASMNAADVAPSRFEAARAECRRIVDGMRLGDETAVIAVGTPPRVLCGMTDHQRTLRDALDAATPTDGPTRVPDAVALARRLLADGPAAGRGVVVVSDGGFDGAGELSKSNDVEMIAVGGKASNIGITRLQARRSLLDPIGYEILVEVLNASDDPAECRLELDLDDQPVDVVPLKLKPGERVTQIFEKASADGGLLRAKVDHGGALAADDSAVALLPKRSRRKVRLETAGDLFLEKVFEAMPLVDLEVVKDPAAEPSPGAPPALTVFDGRTPEVLPPGPILVISPESSNTLWKVADKIQDPVVAKQDGDSPLMTHIRLDRILMPEARKLVLGASAKPKVLAETATGDPLYAVLDRPEGKVVVLTVDLDKSDLPLQTAFPIMTTNLLSWLSGSQGELREALATGATTETPLPAEADPRATRVLRPPTGPDRPLPTAAASIGLGPLDRAGIWKVVRITPPESKGDAKAAPTDQTLLEIACNVGDRRETDLRPPEGLEARAEPALAGLFSRPLWFYLVACAWGLTSWEWILHQRRWID